MPHQLKHILVIRLSAMGDVAMTVPVLRALTHQYSELKITVLTKAFFAPFFEDIPNVSILNADVKEKHKGIFGLYKLSKEIRDLHIDAVADLHNVLRSNVLKLFLLGIPFQQINKGRAEKKALVSGKIFKALKSTHQRYADVFEGLGFKVDLSNPKFPEVKALSDNSIALLGEKTQKWIGIAPFATYESKMYPLSLMDAVINELSKKNKVILFGGGKQEISVLNKFQEGYINTISIAGKLTLSEELEIISNLDVMLSMDSGNAHIAAMFGLKVITIWGVTHPYAGFSPFNQNEDFMLLSDRRQYPKIPTSVYGNKYPENYNDAAKTILPEEVVEKINSVI